MTWRKERSLTEFGQDKAEGKKWQLQTFGGLYKHFSFVYVWQAL